MTWEYTTVSLDLGMLNDFGKEGWEAVAIFPSQSGKGQSVLLKRRMT